MKKLQKEKDLLKNAIRDLEGELQDLRRKKRKLEERLNVDSGQLDRVKEQEIRLRNLISLCMKKEDSLLKKKTRAKDKLAAVEKRIEKVRSIERELEDV